MLPTVQTFENGATDLEHLEQIVNGDETVVTRLGAERKSIKQYQDEFTAAIAAAGYESLGDWTSGMTFNSFAEVAYFNGVPYKLSPSATVPYVAQSDDPTSELDASNVTPWLSNQTYTFASLEYMKLGINVHGGAVSGALKDGLMGFLTDSVRHGDFICRAAENYTDEIAEDTQNGKYIPVTGEEWVWVRTSQLTFESFGASSELDCCSDAFNGAGKTGLEVVNGGSKSYAFTEKVYITESETKFDLGDAAVEWNGVNVNSSSDDRTNGIFNARGSVVDGTEVEATITIELDSDDLFTNVITFDELPSWMESGVWFYIYTPYDTENPSNRYSHMMEVESVDGTTVYVLDKLKYSYAATATIRQIDPIFDIEIKNFKGTDSTSSSDDNAVCGINIMSAVRPKVSGVDFDGMYNPVVTAYTCYAPEVIGGEARNAKSTSGGRGYYVQFGSSRYCKAEDLILIKGRHIVDFTCCGFGEVKRCHGIDNDETEFSMHGQFEHDIVIEDSTGSVGIAISGDSFGNYAENIVLRNIKGEAFYNYTLAKNVSMHDCTFDFWSTNCQKFEAHNSSALLYARIKDNDGISAKIHGGTVVSETYEGANFIIAPPGVVEFYGTRVVSERSSGATVNMDYFTMYGGTFVGGFMTPRFKGFWSFVDTTFEATTFELNNNVYGGSVLSMTNPKLSSPLETGLIRNKIPDYGIREPDEDEAQSLDERFTVVIRGGYLDPGEGNKSLDFDKPQRCLNIDIDGTSVISGVLVCDMRWPTSNEGSLNVNFAYIDSAVSGAPLMPSDYRHYYNLSDLDAEFGVSTDKNRHNRITRTVFRVAQTGDEGFLDYNYPLDTAVKGLLVVEFDQDSNYCVQTLYYMYPGKEYDGKVYRRIYNGSSWFGWTEI